MRYIGLFMVALAAFMLGGCGPKWKIVSQADPNPLVGQQEFVVLPVDFSDLRIGKKTEEEYLADKKDKSVESFLDDKVAMDEKFSESVQAAAERNSLKIRMGSADAPIVLRPHITFLEPGYNAVISKAPAKAVLILRIETKDGKLVDEIEFRESTNKGFASGSRYRDIAHALGKQVAEYLKKRVASK